MTNWPTKKLGEVVQLIEPILRKYEKLGLTESILYSKLKNNLKNQTWIDETQRVLNKVKNSKSIFSINKEITKDKNDQRVLEMFSEFDGARWLAQGAIDGQYDEIQYLKKKPNNINIT